MSEEAVVNAVEVEATETQAEVVTDQNTSEQATEPKVEETTDTDILPEKQPKPGKNSFERKMDRLYKTAAEQKARADFLERQLEELKPKPEVKPDGLRIEDFDYDVEKYAEAKAKAAESAAIKRYQEEGQAKTQKQQMQQLTETWESGVSKSESKYDDFHDVVGDLKPGSPVIIAIMQAENGPDIAYYLGKNIQEAQRIAKLDPITAVREIGRLEAKLLAEPVKAKEPSKAPSPIEPVTGSKSTAKSFLDDDISQEEFERLRRKSLKR
jgi:hypothetical protein